ncbi:MAG: hypothetical protein HY868_16710 [Chloroflexi bacterium]|nr:hypothetical protein [Chloroflexota bacterium]
MTTEETRAIVAVLQTLNETPQGGPESAIYLALGADLDLWHTIKAALIETNLIDENHNWVTITPNGKEAIARINAVIAKHATVTVKESQP